MTEAQIFITLACIFGFLMTWGIGANDLANIMSTAMGSKALTVRQAIIIAIIFEFAGALFGGTEVSETIRSGIIKPGLLSHDPELLIFGMLAILLAGTTWMFAATSMGMPVSITNAIVGGLVGFAVVVFGVHAVHWSEVTRIAVSWICSPMIAGVLAYTLFRSIQKLIFESEDPSRYAKRYLPIYSLLIGLVLSNMVIVKGLQHFQVPMAHSLSLKLALACALLVTLFINLYSYQITVKDKEDLRCQFQFVERLFSVLMALTACAMVFAHGSNDVSIAVGPIAAVFSAVKGHVLQQNPMPIWVVCFASAGVVLGLVIYGRKVIETVGSSITALTPSRAFAATLAAATTVIVSTGTGIPVSATQTLVGAVLGVGLARGIGALNMTVIRHIFLSWVVTLPAASILAVLYYYLFKTLMH